MRYDNQVLHDKGYRNLAYQLEALMDKAPHLEDDFQNLSTIILDELETNEVRSEDNFERGRETGYDEGYSEGYSEAEWENEGQYECGFEDGRSEGYEEGYQEGYEVGQEEGSQILH